MLRVEYIHEDYTADIFEVPVSEDCPRDIFQKANITDKENYIILTETNEIPKYSAGESLVLKLTLKESAKRDATLMEQIGTFLHKQLMFNLKKKLLEHEYVQHFIENDGVSKIIDSIKKTDGNTQSYALTALRVLMSDEYGFNTIVGWGEAGNTLYELMTKDTPVNVARQAAEICLVLTTFCGPDIVELAAQAYSSRTQTKRFVNVVELLSSGDVQTVENTLLLLQSLMNGKSKTEIIALMKEQDVGNKLKLNNSDIVKRVLREILSDLGTFSDLNQPRKGWDDYKLLRPKREELDLERVTIEKSIQKQRAVLKDLNEQKDKIVSMTLTKAQQLQTLEEQKKDLERQTELIRKKTEEVVEFPPRDVMIAEIKSSKKAIDSFEFERTLLKGKIVDIETKQQVKVDFEENLTKMGLVTCDLPPPPALMMEQKQDITCGKKRIVTGYIRNAFMLLQSRVVVSNLLNMLNGESREVDDQSVRILMKLLERSEGFKLENEIGDIKEYTSVDQYALTILKEPFVIQKARMAEQCSDILTKLDEYLTPLRTIEVACNALKKSSALKGVLTVILNTGNFVNSGCSTLERADGFGVEILPMLKYIGKTQSYAQFFTTSVDVSALETELKVCCDVDCDLATITGGLRQVEAQLVNLNKTYTDTLASGGQLNGFKKSIEMCTNKTKSYIAKSNQVHSLFKETLYYFTGDDNAENIYSTLTFFGVFAEFIIGFTIAAEQEERQARKQKEADTNRAQMLHGTGEDPMSQIIAQLKNGQAGKQLLKK